MSRETLRGHLDTLLLAALERGPSHGYAAIVALEERSGGAFALAEGSVYPALHRLERSGLLSSRWTVAEGRRRRIYSLTDAGREALRERRDEWRRFSSALGAVLGASS